MIGRMTSTAAAQQPLPGVRGLVFLGFPLHPAGRPDTERADHLACLAFDAVWLSPLFQSRTSHGYDVANYYRVGDAVAAPGDAEASLELAELELSYTTVRAPFTGRVVQP